MSNVTVLTEKRGGDVWVVMARDTLAQLEGYRTEADRTKGPYVEGDTVDVDEHTARIAAINNITEGTSDDLRTGADAIDGIRITPG